MDTTTLTDVESRIEELDRHFNHLSNELEKCQRKAKVNYSKNNSEYEQDKKKSSELKTQMLSCAEEVVELGSSTDFLGLNVQRIVDGAQTYVYNNKPKGIQPGQDN